MQNSSIPVHPAKLFSYTGPKSFIIEASDFGPVGTAWKGQVRSDCAGPDNDGFIMRFDSGTELLFTVVTTRISLSNELEAWLLVSEDGSCATVLND